MKSFDAVFGSLAMAVVGVWCIVCITTAYRIATSTDGRSEKPRLDAASDNPRPDAVIGYERLDDVGYIYTARHRGHLYIGAVVHAGVALLHSPECDCRSAEAAE